MTRLEQLVEPVRERGSVETGCPRVWILTNAPSPYQVELLAEIQRQGRVEPHVRFLRVPTAASLPSQLAELDHRELWGCAPRSWRDEVRFHPRAVWETAFGQYDCFVLSGLYTSVTFLACAFMLCLRGRPWSVWLEQPRVGPYRERSWWTRPLAGVRDCLLKFLLRRATRVIGIGSIAVQVYREMGVDAKNLLMLPYCCDIARFAEVQSDDSDVRSIRERYHLDGNTVFLFSGQMIERKGADTALRAFELLVREYSQVAFLLLGKGPLREQYESQIPAEVRDRVHFVGFVSQQELPQYFAAADVFVFPSRHDGWGVVINEACAAGMPVIASQQTGATGDLVEDGSNGFVLDCQDVDGFNAKMKYFVEQPDEIQAFGERSRKKVQPFSVENGAGRFCCQIHEIMNQPR